MRSSSAGPIIRTRRTRSTGEARRTSRRASTFGPAEQFESVLARPGSGNKAPDALLKLGMCHDRLGASQRAREYWDRLKNDYPRSDAAKRIPAVGRKTSGTSTGAREDGSPDRKGPKENR